MGTNHSRELELGRKFLKFLKEMLFEPLNLLLFTSFILFTSLNVMNKIRRELPPAPEILFLFMIIICHFIGAFAPPMAQSQYFYAPIPFMILFMIHVIARHDKFRKAGWLLKSIGFVIITFNLYGFRQYPNFSNLLSPHEWISYKAHKRGLMIANYVGKGPVLTLAPLFPLEGGVEIYEQLATGPFAWRVSRFFLKSQREEFGIISPEDLEDFLKLNPPKGILVRKRGSNLEEAPLINYARENKYKELKATKGKTLWVR
jgi:hypothetical protein